MTYEDRINALKDYTLKNRSRIEKLRTDSSELEKITNEVWDVLGSAGYKVYVEYFLKLAKLLDWAFYYDTTDLDDDQNDQVFIVAKEPRHVFFFSPDFQSHLGPQKDDKDALIRAFREHLDNEFIAEDLVDYFMDNLTVMTIDDFDVLTDDEIDNA